MAGLAKVAPFVDHVAAQAQAAYRPTVNPMYAAAAAYGAPAAMAAPAEEEADESFTFQEHAVAASGKVKFVLDELSKDPELSAATKLLKMTPDVADQVEASAQNEGITLYVPTNSAFNDLSDGFKKQLLGVDKDATKSRAKLMGQHMAPLNSGIQVSTASDPTHGGFMASGPMPRGTFVKGAILAEHPGMTTDDLGIVAKHHPRTRDPQSSANIVSDRIIKASGRKFRIVGVDKVITTNAGHAKGRDLDAQPQVQAQAQAQAQAQVYGMRSAYHGVPGH